MLLSTRFQSIHWLSMLLCCLAISCLTTGLHADDTASTEQAVEAEALIDLYGGSDQYRVSAYEHASGKASLCTNNKPLIWKMTPKHAGTFYLWVRVRSGWNGDRFYHEKDAARYDVKLGSRIISMQSLHETLEWHGDGQNFIWLCSEPLNLDAVSQRFEVLPHWEWSHIDCLLLTGDRGYNPGIGNVAANEQRAGQLDVWVGDPYTHPFNPEASKPDSTNTVMVLTGPRGGTAQGGMFVRLESRRQDHVPFRMYVNALTHSDGQSLSVDAIQIAPLVFTGMREGAPLAADALPKINPMGAFDLVPQYTRLFWVQVDIPNHAKPGDYVATVNIENQVSLKQQNIQIKLHVAQTQIDPAFNKLTTFSFWGHHSRPTTWWNDQINHGINSYLLYVQSDLKYQFDANGDLIGSIDFSNLQPLLRTWRKTRGHILVQWYLHDQGRASLVCQTPQGTQGQPLPFMSQGWRKAFGKLLLEIHTYLEAQGVPRDRIVHYTFDEYLGEKFIQVSKVIRSLDRSYLIFSDLSADLETYRRVEPYLDIWCPWFADLQAMSLDGRLDFMRSTGKPIWFYDPGYLQRGESPYTKFRIKFWLSWRYQLDGCTYWKHQGDHVGTGYYAMSPELEPVTSRRYEAWYSGWQDYQLIHQLNTLANSDAQQANVAKQLVDQAVTDVCDHPDDSSMADRYRQKILELLDQNSSQ